MPNNVNATYSVSEVTDMFSDIIREQPTLQNVWVRGRISSRNTESFFNIKDLRDPDNVDNQIQCHIPAPLAGNAPSVDTEVFVKGRVILFRDIGVYRFSVTDIETSRPNPPNPTLPVSFLIQTLRTCVDTLTTRIGPDPITVQGEIYGQPVEIGGFTHLTLRNVGAMGNGATEVIECRLSRAIADGFAVRQGDRVSVEGQFTIFPPMSRYQIDASNTARVLTAGPQDGENQSEATYSVSEAANRLSEIIGNQPTLQNVWVRGRISSNPEYLPYAFILQDMEAPNSRIECLIHRAYSSLFQNVPSIGNEVFVKVSVILLRDKGVYKFAVTGIETPSTGQPDPTVSVSSLMNTLQTSIEPHLITVQGEIFEWTRTNRGFIRMALRNVDANESGATETIECTLSPAIAGDFSSGEEDNVSIEGHFNVFPSTSRYQIRTRSIRVLPDGFQDGEAQVVREVKSYFSELRQEFSTARECEIQMGVGRRRADIVLIDPEGGFAAIAECKPENVVGYGPDQLKSYLCATDTRFGVFANSINPDNWVFYENLRHNRFQQIERSEFETRVVERPVTQHQLQDRIRELESKYERLESQICGLMESD